MPEFSFFPLFFGLVLRGWASKGCVWWALAICQKMLPASVHTWVPSGALPHTVQVSAFVHAGVSGRAGCFHLPGLLRRTGRGERSNDPPECCFCAYLLALRLYQPAATRVLLVLPLEVQSTRAGEVHPDGCFTNRLGDWRRERRAGRGPLPFAKRTDELGALVRCDPGQRRTSLISWGWDPYAYSYA